MNRQSTRKVIMMLSKTDTRPENIRVVAEYRTTNLYTVEMYSDFVGAWIINAEWTTEQEALQDAINWYK